ncbi:hypothetical protein NBRC116494_02750 [Aurantivibrio plasticivorans]
MPVKVVRSVFIGVLLIASAVGCFIAADFCLRQTSIERLVITSAFGPIENVFLILLIPIITVVVALFRIGARDGEPTSRTTWLKGIAVFIGCELSAGVFGVPGIGAFLAAAHWLAAVLNKGKV